MAVKRKSTPNKAQPARASSTNKSRPGKPQAAKPRVGKPLPDKSAAGERLQKILAAAGLGSRRDCEELIVTGRVEVNRRVVTELGARANADDDEIRVDGTPLRKTRRVYYALNKPPGIVCTNRDPGGRTRAIDLIESNERLFTIGRLDRSSEGLILITNDGDLANRLTHPRYGVEKTYRVEVAGHPTPEELKPLREGVRLAEGVVRVDSLVLRKRFGKSTELEIVLTEGMNREIRRILAKVGHKVLRLTRVAIGRLPLGEMPTGAYRELTRRDIDTLLLSSGSSDQPAGAVPRRNRSASRPARTAGPGRPNANKSSANKSNVPPTKGGRPIGGKPAIKKKSSAKAMPRMGSVIGDEDDAGAGRTISPATESFTEVPAKSTTTRFARPGKKPFKSARGTERGSTGKGSAGKGSSSPGHAGKQSSGRGSFGSGNAGRGGAGQGGAGRGKQKGKRRP